MSSKRLLRHPDLIEWTRLNRVDLASLKRERQKLEKGFVAYGKDIIEFFRDMRGSKKSDAVVPENPDKVAAPAEKTASKSLLQYHQSQELLKRLKWKRATWDEEADYESFSQRLLENDAIFSKCPAFSFLSVHIVKDPLSTTSNLSVQFKTKIDEGDMVQWILTERDAAATPPFELQRARRRAPFIVDWISGEVRILDSASPTEVLTFLSTAASRLQALQVKMEEQQQKITADLENVRIRVGLTRLRYNTTDVSMWDDERRKTDPTYVNPDELTQFLNTMLKAAFLYRQYLKGHQIRVMRPGTSYHVDLEQKELRIPANFDDFSFLPIHKKFESIENVFNFFRTFWWFWFAAALVLIGDVELL